MTQFYNPKYVRIAGQGLGNDLEKAWTQHDPATEIIIVEWSLGRAVKNFDGSPRMLFIEQIAWQVTDVQNPYVVEQGTLTYYKLHKTMATYPEHQPVYQQYFTDYDRDHFTQDTV